ncbi:MAG: proton-conducting transporter membrane subunit [Candidatus Omnitrophica bacterium]|nr:proton-conducting transporter membrane subunit [Candidatus Omnitrophota bacterium]
MTQNLLFLPIIIPLAAAIICILTPRNLRPAQAMIALAATLINLLISAALWGRQISFSAPWLGIGFEFSLRLYHFSAFIMLSVASFGFLVTLYSTVFMRDRNSLGQFYAYFLLTLSFAAGAVLADNLLVLLLFWEGLLLALFGMIIIGNKSAFKTATKAFIIVGITDLCMMTGIALTGKLAGTLTMSQINLPLGGLGSVAFILLMIGAISKGGAMPFHTWIPDAAVDAPLPFMALVPAALEKLLGIYFLTRISLDLFQLNPGSWVSVLLMTIGAVTIILAVMMALVQKDYKRLLSYHAISQVGYMILGIGTAVPAGIIGGLFHMINNALYKSCLFLTGGSVEKQAGTTNLEELGGLRSRMPVTFACFVITALAISGVPPFNGFFSRELVYDGALSRGCIFYVAAVAGSFFTAASFLKLGHAAFLGKINDKNKGVKEASFAMLFPMMVIALICVLFGLYNYLPINKLIQPVLGEARLEGHDYSGFPHNITLVLVTVIVLIGALANHIFGVKRTGAGLKAVDHIHYAPGLSQIYSMAEKRYFDPYEIGMKFAQFAARIIWRIDRAIDWVYDSLLTGAAHAFSKVIRGMHTGYYPVYIAWSILGTAAVLLFALK